MGRCRGFRDEHEFKSVQSRSSSKNQEIQCSSIRRRSETHPSRDVRQCRRRIRFIGRFRCIPFRSAVCKWTTRGGDIYPTRCGEPLIAADELSPITTPGMPSERRSIADTSIYPRLSLPCVSDSSTRRQESRSPRAVRTGRHPRKNSIVAQNERATLILVTL